MAIANCKRCGQMFNSVGDRIICKECVAEQEEAFELVRAYLKKHREASMAEVVRATEVDEASIAEMIRDGRLYIEDNPHLSLGCEHCGQEIKSGRLCSDCANSLNASFEHTRQDLRRRTEAARRRQSGYHSR